MSIGDFLKGVGGAAATAGKVAGAVLEPVGKAVAEEESGQLPEIEKEKRARKFKGQDEELARKTKFLENQLALDEKYGTLTPEQRTQLKQEYASLGQPKQEPSMIQKLHKAIHPGGATYQHPIAPLPSATPEGGTQAADAKAKLNSSQQTADQQLQNSLKAIDRYAAQLKAYGVPDEQVNAAKNDAIEKAMGAVGNVLPKSPKLDLQGNIMVGGTDEHGRVFTNAQIKSGEAGPTLKSMMDDYEKGEQKKADDAEKKERDRQKASEDRQNRSEGAMSDRQRKSEEFQEGMLDKREKMSEYKKASDAANASQSIVDTYKTQYAQPGNHSASDTALIADYTSVLAKGGRKTQAELQMARNIGSFQLNMKQKVQKALTGELPPELRNMMMQYMESAAKTQREDAEKIKGEPPSTGAKPVGQVLPKTGAHSSKGTVSLTKARSLPQYQGKSDADITAAAKALGYEVKP